ncbi:GGDEF domain-containing protein [Thaumasiovibrio subtropicus]|uniref:GGDEF domain-containing protein n=1 Tax=Thaumasiovibrio subtropicus TaxID=1891207 RepID=UPI000B34E847|nr:GGDEF domain-containing protein [Thaumasiovibrio subtropicus]
MSVFQVVLSLGTHNKSSTVLQGIKMTNLYSLVMMSAFMVNVVLFYFHYHLPMPLTVVGLFALFSLFGLTLVLNGVGLNFIAQLWLISIYTSTVFASHLFIFSSHGNYIWNIVVVYPLLFLIWGREQQRFRVIVLTVVLVLFIGSSLVSYSIEPVVKQPGEFVNLLAFINVTLFLSLMAWQFTQDIAVFREMVDEEADADQLTGVLSKVQFEFKMKEALRWKGSDECHSLMVIDLDRFRQINEQFGHEGGDKALTSLVDGILAVKPEDVLLGRLYADRFCLFWLNDTEEEAVLTASHIARNINLASVEFNNQLFPLQISAGLTTERQRKDLARLFNASNDALYRAKRSGRGCLAVSEGKIITLVNVSDNYEESNV